MADKKWMKMFPIANYGEFNLDFLLEKYGEQDDRIKKVEEKNDEQDDRLDEDDTLIANLRADLTTETNQRTAADNSLSDRITAEVSARIAGDSTLQGNIDAEKAARQAADAQLSTDIASEASARTAADTALQSNITAEATARANADTTLQTNITAEATARANADTTLQTNITAEATARANADTALQNAINAKYSVVEATVGDHGWQLAGANALDVFNINKTVVLKDVYSGYYYSRTSYEDHGTTLIASFELMEGSFNPIQTSNPHLVVLGFQITSADSGATISTVQQFSTHLLDSSNEVIANDSTGTAGGDLTSLKVGNTSYTVPQGGQGTTVVANPSGTPTAQLDSVQIGSTIYSTPTGAAVTTQDAVMTPWQQAEEGGATRGDIYFTNLAPGVYVVNYDLIYNVSGTDTSNIEWELHIGHTNIQPIVSSESTVEFSGQIIEYVQSGSTSISTRITATNSSDDFSFILSDTVSSEKIIRIR